MAKIKQRSKAETEARRKKFGFTSSAKGKKVYGLSKEGKAFHEMKKGDSPFSKGPSKRKKKR